MVMQICSNKTRIKFEILLHTLHALIYYYQLMFEIVNIYFKQGQQS